VAVWSAKAHAFNLQAWLVCHTPCAASVHKLYEQYKLVQRDQQTTECSVIYSRRDKGACVGGCRMWRVSLSENWWYSPQGYSVRIDGIPRRSSRA
jgi:hypothetical protein